MTSLLDEPHAAADDGLIGDQRPRVLWVPPGAASSAGREAVELAASVGLVLDDWQQFTLDQGLGETDRGLWLAYEVAELVSRQNGKDGELEALELAALYLFGVKLALHSTHRFKTTLEHFRRLVARITNYDDLRRRVKRINYTHGEESIELLGDRRLEFMARSTSSGRGFSGELLIMNEAQILADSSMEAMLPTLSARPFGTTQIWYMLTAPDPEKVGPCEVAARLRRRALKGGDPGLVYLEWSIDPHVDECPLACQKHDNPADPRSWAKANPALGIRIDLRTVQREMASMSADGFLRERLGVGRWPVDEAAWQVISQELWVSRADARSQILDSSPMAFAADMTPDQSAGAIGVAGECSDGGLHVEVVDPGRPGTDWIVPRLIELAERHKPCAVVIDAAGTAGRWVAPLEAARIEVVKPSSRDAAAACGQLYDAVAQGTLRHIDQPALAGALAGAERRPLGDAWAWARKTSSVDISPLVAVTLAAWGHATRAHLAKQAPAPFALRGK